MGDATMATSDIEKVLSVFKGIGDRDPDIAVKSLHPTKYTQHNPRAFDGVAGVKELIARLPCETSPPTTIRALQDGSYAFTHTVGNVLGQNIFFDIFRLEDSLVVEHWVFSAKAAPPNKSGHTQTDGPTEARHHQETETNKLIIREYYQTVHVSGDHGKVPQYSTDDCIRHEPGVSDGLEAFMRDLDAATRHGGASRSIDEIKILLGYDDLVFVAAKGSVKGEPSVYIDLYRIEGGKIAEHWGIIEDVPPREEWKNANGML
jgi:predicted SnoaL-like aldol condensation-catalyzing enzyme